MDRLPTRLPVLSLALVAAFAPSVAHAHLGHVGEIAGHSHWLGLGALAAAAAALALLAKKRRRDEDKAEEEQPGEGEASGPEEAGEAAEAS